MRRAGDAGASPAPAPEHPTGRGARIYQEALCGAGGRELHAWVPTAAPVALGAAVYACPPYQLRVPPLPVARVSVNLTRSAVSGGVEGDPPRRFDARRYSLFVTPAHTPVSWHKESPSRHLGLYFDARSWPRDVGEGGLLPLQPLFNATVPGLHPLVDELVAEIQSPRMLSGEAADSIGRLLLVHLSREMVRAASHPPSLTPAMLGRLRDYVQARLTERILVADLAHELGLPASRFAADFTRVTGQPPYRFVLAVRLDKAAGLLARSSLSLAEVAQECGFASQQHLSNAIRRHTGTTPSRYRRQHRPEAPAAGPGVP